MRQSTPGAGLVVVVRSLGTGMPRGCVPSGLTSVRVVARSSDVYTGSRHVCSAHYATPSIVHGPCQAT